MALGLFASKKKSTPTTSPFSFSPQQPSTRYVTASQSWKTNSVDTTPKNMKPANPISKSADNNMVRPEGPSNLADIASSTYPNAICATNPRLPRFSKILSEPNVDIDALRKLCWSGIPNETRAVCWRLLLGYLPTNLDRQGSTLDRKRKEYEDFVDQYFTKVETEYEKGLYKQIEIDLPRTHPDIKLFQNEAVQKSLQRILYIWAVRHPATGYVQGINDLATPFFIVFLTELIGDDYENFPVEHLGPNMMTMIEADCFWCVTKLLDGLTENFTFGQPGIQRMVFRLKELIARIDAPLSKYLEENEVQYIQFSYRWMNCLLMREISLPLIIRMWDTYFSEGDLAMFHVYVCAAYLKRWSKQIQAQSDFPNILLFLQNPPTQDWTARNVEEILSEAFLFMSLYQDSPSHLRAE